jgi:molecular chaperone IbpA
LKSIARAINIQLLRSAIPGSATSKPLALFRAGEPDIASEEDVTMFDLSPLYRSTIGFDHLAGMLDDLSTFEAPSYPPYNIEKLGEDDYRITMAVAGFGESDLNIELKQNVLTISGKKADRQSTGELLHQGIASRGFERRFQLADHVVVAGAELENGLLHVTLKREVPEAMKPRTIPINGKGPKTIEGRKAA